NDRPHLGTFTHLLSADVYSRYLRLKGEDVVMVSGSDEHGAPIEVEAIKRKITPRQLTNQYHRVFTRSIRRFNIQFDNYTRTESLFTKSSSKNSIAPSTRTDTSSNRTLSCRTAKTTSASCQTGS